MILVSNALLLSINLTFIVVMNSFNVTDVTLAVAVVHSVSIASIVDEEETAEARAYFCTSVDSSELAFDRRIWIAWELSSIPNIFAYSV
jgi:hypothetical protein